MSKSTPSATPLWAPVPPMGQPNYVRIVWPRVGTKVTGYMLNQRPEGCWVHVVIDGKTIRTPPCLGREHGCELCRPNARYRWQGYCPILDHRSGRMLIAQVTKEAARCCPPLHDPRRMLRGKFLTLERVGLSRESRVRAEVQDVADPRTLPPELDIREALLNLWGLAPRMVPFTLDAMEVTFGL